MAQRRRAPSSSPSGKASQPAPQPPSPAHIVSETKTPRPAKPPKETSCQGMGSAGQKGDGGASHRERIVRACRCFGGAAAPSAAPGRPAGQSGPKLQKNKRDFGGRGKGERSPSNTAALAVRAKKSNRSLPPCHRQHNLTKGSPARGPVGQVASTYSLRKPRLPG